jgi:hypothetical protein
MAEACRQWRDAIGLYAVDDLGAEDKAALEAHMEGCPHCRAEAESLRDVATLLARVDPARIEESPAPTPTRLGGRVAERIGSERNASRRRLRLRLGFGFAGAAAVGAAVIAIVLGSSGTSTREVEFASLPPGAEITATLEPEPAGTKIEIQVHGMRPGILCRVSLRGADGHSVQAGSFRYGYGKHGSSHAVLSAGMPTDRATAIAVRAGKRTFVQEL